MARRREADGWVDEGPAYARSARQVRDGKSALLQGPGPAPDEPPQLVRRGMPRPTAIAEPIAVARPADANFGCVRARSPETVEEMRRMHEGGAFPSEIAAAYGLSTRTVYRYLGPDRFFDVRIGSWRATFALREGNEPKRVSAWERA